MGFRTSEENGEEKEGVHNAIVDPKDDDVQFLGSSQQATAAGQIPKQQKAMIVGGKALKVETSELFASLALTTIVPSECQDQLMALLVQLAPGSASIVTLASITHAEQLYLLLTTATTSLSSTSSSSSSTTHPYGCSEEQVECWITAAQQILLQHLWSLICGGGSERLRVAYKKLRIRNPRELLPWKTATPGLHSGLLQIDQGLSSIPFFWPPQSGSSSLSASSASASASGIGSNSHSLSIESLQWAMTLCEEVQSAWPWIRQYNVLVDDEDSEAATTAAADEDEASWDDAWETSVTAHVYLDQTCRVLIRGGENQEGEVEGEGEEVGDTESAPLLPPGSFWEDGKVVAYLPPTDEEPMALWRVLLQEAPTSSTSRTRYEDMEAHEVVAALRRYALTQQGAMKPDTEEAV